MASKTKVMRKAGPTPPRGTSEEAHSEVALEVVDQDASLDPEPGEAEMTGAPAATPRARSATAARTAASAAGRDLQRANKELQVRIRELELRLAGGTQEAEGEAGDYGELSEESTTVIAEIKDLHSKMDAARELREALETDLAAMKEKWASEQTARTEAEARVKLLDARAALGDQLREDLAFVEDERDEIARRLEQATSQLGQITEERDRLAEQKITDDERIKALHGDKIGLEAKVLNLGETVADLDRLRQDLVGSQEELQRVKETVQSLKGKLNATEIARNALELDLTATREVVRKQGGQIDELRANLTAAHVKSTELRAELDQREIENTNLLESNKRAERELKTLTERLEFTKRNLELSKKALRAIRAAAMRTTGQNSEDGAEA